MTHLLQIAQERLAWPSTEEIFRPQGPGSQVLVESADRKIGNELRRLAEDGGVRVGMIVADPSSETTGSGLAIVCDFPRPPTAEELSQAHRLAWNFSRAPLLMVVDPYHIRVWSCYELPAESELEPPVGDGVRGPPTELERLSADSLSTSAATAFDWVDLVSGSFLDRYPDRFRPESRADQTLLANLRFVRSALHERGLEYPVIHDLLARIIFIQYLVDRKDSSGKTALDEDRLRVLCERGILSHEYPDFSAILHNYSDTYHLFRYLNEHFNGDLFQKQHTDMQTEMAWQAEMDQVDEAHIELLADFVGGRLDMGKGQFSLWRLYSFDAIPLEFISSIYEEFVAKRPGTVYTPPFLVDFVLDMALPWRGTDWDLRVLDPACGSGIFLVKVFQRLVFRWKQAHPGERLQPRQLRRLLGHNIFGVDSDEHAIKVAAFSLYLAMCDEIEPKYYWHHVTFPQLRGKRLVHADFFEEDTEGFRTTDDNDTFDLVVGNVPWARGSLQESSSAQEWEREFEWSTFDRNIGPLFLGKAARLARATGRVTLLQPATLLFSNFAAEFRRRLFSTFHVDEVINLALLRRDLFEHSAAPACIISFEPREPTADRILYISPKPARTEPSVPGITIEPQDVEHIYPKEATDDPHVWSALVWGGRRDLALVRRLSENPTLRKLQRAGRAVARNGIMRGKSRRKLVPELMGRLFLGSGKLPLTDPIHLDVSELDRLEDPYMHEKDSTNFGAFEPPQLIIGRSWRVGVGRFQAGLVGLPGPAEGVVCNQSFVSAHVTDSDKHHLEAACLAYNSDLAVYYFFLTSGRFASYRPNLTVGDLLSLPYPRPTRDLVQGMQTLRHVNARIRAALRLDEVEWALVEDLCRYGVTEVHSRRESEGRRRTREGAEGDRDPVLASYCHFFMKVIRAGIPEADLSATVFVGRETLPVRLAAIHLDWPGSEGVRIVRHSSSELRRRLVNLNERLLKLSKGENRVQRIARVYSVLEHENLRIPTVFLIKPDQMRYWTRSAALRDADEVIADALLWRRHGRSEVKGAFA